MFSQDWPYLKRRACAGSASACRTSRSPRAASTSPAMPELALAEGLVDFCVLGEGEETLVELLDAIGSGRRSARGGGGSSTATGRDRPQRASARV
jgi:radical SAM superfamily enzyme YgiQ (UPF0313 family)